MMKPLLISWCGVAILAKICWKTYPWNLREIDAVNPWRLTVAKLWIINEGDNSYKSHL